MRAFQPVLHRACAVLAGAAACLLPTAVSWAEDGFAPYGRAQIEAQAYTGLDTVWDVNYEDPNALGALYSFVLHTQRATGGKAVVVTHGPELRAFAIENYEIYQGVVDQMAELADLGVQFRMCGQAMRAAGFEASDMHGFITVIPIGFAELALWQSRGHQYMNPIPLTVRDVRYLDQPPLQK